MLWILFEAEFNKDSRYMFLVDRVSHRGDFRKSMGAYKINGSIMLS